MYSFRIYWTYQDPNVKINEDRPQTDDLDALTHIYSQCNNEKDLKRRVFAALISDMNYGPENQREEKAKINVPRAYSGETCFEKSAWKQNSL